jgi:S-adenosylmethionine synthetase
VLTTIDINVQQIKLYDAAALTNENMGILEGLRLASTGLREDTAIQAVAGTSTPATDGYALASLTVVGFTDAQIQEKAEQIFDLRPLAIIRRFNLDRPHGWSYRETAAYGHFGRANFPWEQTEKVAELKAALGI